MSTINITTVNSEICVKPQNVIVRVESNGGAGIARNIKEYIYFDFSNPDTTPQQRMIYIYMTPARKAVFGDSLQITIESFFFSGNQYAIVIPFSPSLDTFPNPNWYLIDMSGNPGATGRIIIT